MQLLVTNAAAHGAARPMLLKIPQAFETSISRRAWTPALVSRLVAAIAAHLHHSRPAPVVENDVALLDDRLRADIGLATGEVEHARRRGSQGGHQSTHDPFTVRQMLTITVLAVSMAALLDDRCLAAEDSRAGLIEPEQQRDHGTFVRATGLIEPLRLIAVSTEQSGAVRKVHVGHNDRVRAGQLLAELERGKLAAGVDRARAKLATAKARLRDAEATRLEKARDLERRAKLAERGYSAGKDLEAAQAASERADAALEVAAAEVRMSDAELQIEEVNLAQTNILSPIDGIVLRRMVEPGQMLLSSQLPVLFAIASDLDVMMLTIDLVESDIGRVSPGQIALFEVVAFLGRTFRAKVEQVRIAPESGRRGLVYKAILVANNPDHALKPGMNATVRVLVAPFAPAIVQAPNADAPGTGPL